MLAEAVEADPPPPRFRQHPALVGAGRQDDNHVEACRDPAHPGLGQIALDGTHEHVAAAPVPDAHSPQVPVELPALEEVREGELLEPRRRNDRVQLLLGERADER